MIKPDDLFDLSKIEEPILGLIQGIEQVWEILAKIETYLTDFLPKQAGILGQVDEGAVLVNSESIYVGQGTHVEAGAYIAGPTYIGTGCQVRQGAYIRGSVIAGNECVLGHASEFKNALLLSGSHAAHFAYVGDSILGHNVNLGAGTKLSNLGMFSDDTKSKIGHRPTIKLRLSEESEPVDTGLAKMGAILGDGAQTGCNVVTNPGCIVGRGTLIYPNASIPKGYWTPGKIIKLRQTLHVVPFKK